MKDVASCACCFVYGDWLLAEVAAAKREEERVEGGGERGRR
jgi:hypothetical protein